MWRVWDRWSHGRCGMRLAWVCFLSVEICWSPQGEWGLQSAAGEAEPGMAAQPPDLALECLCPPD